MIETIKRTMTAETPNDQTPHTGQRRRLQVAVVGCGVMGRNHARLCSELKGVDLNAIVEPDPAQRSRVAQQFNCLAYADISDIDLNSIDAFCISAPTIDHGQIAAHLILHNKPCLIEKPLASDMESCRKLADLQIKSGVPVLVGHIERFNPAFVQLESILLHEQIIGIDVQRLSYARARSQDVDVVMDLMIHDIDIVLALLRDDSVIDVRAHGYSIAGKGPEYAVAILRSAAGKIITMTASRVTHNKLRLLQATTANAHIQVDYTDQKIDIHRHGRIRVADGEQTPHYSIETSVEKVIVRHNEPLANELLHFFSCVNGNDTPLVTPTDAMKAIAMAHKIQERIREAEQFGQRGSSPRRMTIS